MIFNNSKFNSHWPTKALNELGTFNRGKSKHRPRNDIKLFKNGNIPLIQTGDVKQANIFIKTHSNNYNEFGLAQSKLWTKGTLCITIAANIAETSMLDYDMCFPDSVVGFNAFPDECSETFMHYIFTYIRAGIQSRIQGSIQDNINIEYLTNLKFKIPIKEERIQIENLLFSFDSKIEINNKINQELEAMAKTLYDYWFVQFDFPDKNDKPYKSSGGKMVFNEDLKREIPVGWEVEEINNVIKVKDGTHDSPKSIKKGFKLITSKHLKLEGLDFEKANYISKEDYVNINKRSQVENGDILFSMIGSIGTVYKIEEKNIDFAIKNVALYKTSGNQNLKNYIYMYLKGYDMQKYMGNVIAGSIQKFIGLGSLRKMPIMFDEKTISNFEVKTKSIFNQINTLKLENQKLSELRDWLLPMLMNGQLRVGGED
ncbi:restriction endonuclease subunit S [Tenacibaculum ovolyticum]|uniref:restriction endonuclease subunit S n=1 Tax=Tenacibaculum ovolyticum TaxID=104270 RepID=UPI001EED9B99|nr:restriction endonuclease subunit S [Tenacibaculum ovolyticum]